MAGGRGHRMERHDALLVNEKWIRHSTDMLFVVYAEQRWIWRNDMKIKEVNDEKILFDNGNTITFDHEQDWCEHNYAQFDALEELAFEIEFDENLTFEAVDGSGFRFGNLPQKMFFIPCYSSQNGYYSHHIDIYYNGENVTGLTCQEHHH